MNNLSEFQVYLIKRIDRIEEKINRLNIRVVKSASLFGAISGVITAIVALLIRIKI